MTIPGAIFNTVMSPRRSCRISHTAVPSIRLMKISFCTRCCSPTDCRWPIRQLIHPSGVIAHLVSLEGFADYLGPDPEPIPASPLQQSRWTCRWSRSQLTFVSMPESFVRVKELVKKLIASEAASQGALRFPAASGCLPPRRAASRMGYVALKFIVGSRETFARYRGPFPPVAAGVGAGRQTRRARGPRDVGHVLTIYQQGLFDIATRGLEYGRNLALADAHFAQAVNRYAHAAKTAVATIAQRRALLTSAPNRSAHRPGSRCQPAALRACGDGLASRTDAGSCSAENALSTLAPVSARTPPRTRVNLTGRRSAAAVGEHAGADRSMADWLAPGLPLLPFLIWFPTRGCCRSNRSASSTSTLTGSTRQRLAPAASPSTVRPTASAPRSIHISRKRSPRRPRNAVRGVWQRCDAAWLGPRHDDRDADPL